MNSSITAVFNAPRLNLAELPPQAVLLCSTARLLHELRLAHDEQQQAAGLTRWPGLPASTLSQWLDGLLEELLLLQPEIPAPGLLGSLQERLLWEEVINEQLANSPGDTQEDIRDGVPAAATLFDIAGMARAAQEAHGLCVLWQLECASWQSVELSLETRQFLRWQQRFLQRCDTLQVMDAARYRVWQVRQLERLPSSRWPQDVVLAGFDRFNPCEQRLLHYLQEQAVNVHELAQGLPGEALASSVQLQPCADRQSECRAAVAWAVAELEKNPQARLGIVVPELQEVRYRLADLLDDELCPAALQPAQSEMPRPYNFSLGEPLARQPLVAAANELLQFFARLHSPFQTLELASVSALLLNPYWSLPSLSPAPGAVLNMDARAQIERRLREYLPAEFSWQRLLRWLNAEAQRCGATDERWQALSEVLQTAAELRQAMPRSQAPSAWVMSFEKLLNYLGWPGERSLSSHEYQQKQAFIDALHALTGLDSVLPLADYAMLRRQLQRICQERIHQPQTEGQPRIEIMGLLEAAGRPLDGLWVMGMNDHLWPPPARPNPLLPAALQRSANTPNASAEVQAAFAGIVHERLLRSAAVRIFSWAEQEGERELRMTPLLAKLSVQQTRPRPFAPTRIERLAALASPAQLEALWDQQAPPVADHEPVRGGTALLKAQAICPAWAFYRYRLAAKPLEAARDELDERERGSLLHAALQAFWQTHGEEGSAALQRLSSDALQTAIALAVEQGLQMVLTATQQELPPRSHALEAERLQWLLSDWLALEAQRPAAFQVLACEKSHEVDIAGIQVKLVIDRIDQLDDGRQLILDYKTGRQQNVRSWAQDRITEPQLPIYAVWPRVRQLVHNLPAMAAVPSDQSVSEIHGAAFAETDTVAADWLAGVAFARVRQQDNAFSGIAASSDLLPKVLAITDDKARRMFPRQLDWAQLLNHWQQSLATIAREIRQGEAAVRFVREQDLAYCEVLPLLRLSERRQLMNTRNSWVTSLASALSVAEKPVSAEQFAEEQP